mgnify:CR=1 FL=1
MVAIKNWLRAVYNNKMGFVQHKNIEVYPKNTSYVVAACQRYGAPLLKKGQTSDYVMVLAQDLRNAGWHTLSGGRTFDDDIYQAVREFQSEYGLSVDGVVGNATKEKLYRKTFVKDYFIISTQYNTGVSSLIIVNQENTSIGN